MIQMTQWHFHSVINKVNIAIEIVKGGEKAEMHSLDAKNLPMRF